MNDEDRKRVPKDGLWWRPAFANGADLMRGDESILDIPDRALARQIVGSVNAAILRYRHGGPSTKRPLSDEGRQIESDIDFWTHYAFAKDQP